MQRKKTNNRRASRAAAGQRAATVEARLKRISKECTAMHTRLGAARAKACGAVDDYQRLLEHASQRCDAWVEECQDMHTYAQAFISSLGSSSSRAGGNAEGSRRRVKRGTSIVRRADWINCPITARELDPATAPGHGQHSHLQPALGNATLCYLRPIAAA